MFAPFSCDVDGINNGRQIVLRKRIYVVALKGLRIIPTPWEVTLSRLLSIVSDSVETEGHLKYKLAELWSK